MARLKPLTDRRLRILRLLAAGRYPAAIAKELQVSRQAVDQHVAALVQEGYVHVDRPMTALQRNALGGGAMKVYGLTDAGRAAVAEAMSSTLPAGGEARLLSPRVEVHGFEVKVPVKRMGIAWLPSAAEMQNWTRRWDPDFHGVYLEVTTQHILLRAGAEGADREEAEGRCLRRLMRVMELLESHYGCELGRPEFRGYGLGKAKVGVLGSGLAVKGYEVGRLASIDSTPEPGTIHPNDPADADRIVQLARNVEDIKALVEHMARLEVRVAEAVLVALGQAPPAAPRPPSSPDWSPEVA